MTIIRKRYAHHSGWETGRAQKETTEKVIRSTDETPEMTE